MSKKTLIIGANGALGSDLLKQVPDALAATHADFDIADYEMARDFIAAAGVRAVVNTAAFHRVPDCEDEHVRAFQTNTVAVRNLAQICGELGIHLCHVSTDYVFDGSKGAPYLESDPPMPLSIYAISKLAGEYALAAYGKDWSVVRSCGLYGRVPTRAKGGNFINTMLDLGSKRELVSVVQDEYVTPTYTLDLAWGIAELLHARGQGIFHITNEGATNWYEFAAVIFETCQLKARLEPTTAAQFQSKVRRPQYSILDNGRFAALTGKRMPHWKDALLRHLAGLNHA